MAANKRGKVRHSGIQWTEKLTDGAFVQRNAMRGEEVSLPVAEYNRLAAFDAFESESAPMEADLWPADGGLSEMVEWLDRHTVEEALDAVRGQQSQYAVMLSAENGRTGTDTAGNPVPREPLVQALTAAQIGRASCRERV